MRTDEQDDGLGHVICRRRLRSDQQGKRIYIDVQLGEPRKRRGSWECPFHISRIGKGLQLAYGEDPFQALILALEGIRVTLDKNAPGCLWLDDPGLGNGFPRFVPQGFGVDLRQRLETVIDREVVKFAKAAERSSRRNNS